MIGIVTEYVERQLCLVNLGFCPWKDHSKLQGRDPRATAGLDLCAEDNNFRRRCSLPSSRLRNQVV